MAEIASEHDAPLWGVSGEFATPEALLAAVRALRDHGLGRLDAFSPVPVPALAEALRLRRTPVIRIGLAAAILGGGAVMFMCLYATAYDYVFIIGGRPRLSWPAYMVPSVSFAMLCGALAALLAFLVLNRLPRLNHPAFNIPGFGRAADDRYFLVVEARDDGFDAEAVERAFASLGTPPEAVARVRR